MIQKFYAMLFMLLLPWALGAQVRVNFELNDLPKAKDEKATYFLSGSFNNWNPADTTFQFKQSLAGSYHLFKPLAAGNYEFKITRGGWAKVETDDKGKPLPNRILKLITDTTIVVNVLSWADNFEHLARKHTKSVNVKVLDSAFYIPQLDKKRRIWIYLPTSYGQSNNYYPVLYMHDGQNLFDEFTSGYGEWKVDEILDKISAGAVKEYIVIGIDHGGSARLNEYNPYDSEYGKGLGKAYTEFLVQTLKPYIDANFRTKTDVKNTSIAGSSMGGLISLYAIATYPKTFGNAGIFSPAFWLAKPLKADLQQKVNVLKGHKIYFVAGALESKSMISDMRMIYETINREGKNKFIKLVEKADGEHKEWFWTREFLEFYNFIAK